MITYLYGDATWPSVDGPTLIAHICNDAGGWGAGFVLAISKRWPGPEAAYREWFRAGSHDTVPFGLGGVQLVSVDTNVWVVNMIAQRGYGLSGRDPHRGDNEDANLVPLRYTYLGVCLEQLGKLARKMDASIHMPRIGTGLGGGRWDRIEPIVARMLEGCEVTVYDWDGKPRDLIDPDSEARRRYERTPGQ